MKTAFLWFFGYRVDAVLNCRELAETESAMLLLLLMVMMMIMMMRVMVLRGRRGLPHATHQAEGTADTSAAATAATGGGARRHRPIVLTEKTACQLWFSYTRAANVSKI